MRPEPAQAIPLISDDAIGKITTSVKQRKAGFNRRPIHLDIG